MLPQDINLTTGHVYFSRCYESINSFEISYEPNKWINKKEPDSPTSGLSRLSNLGKSKAEFYDYLQRVPSKTKHKHLTLFL